MKLFGTAKLVAGLLVASLFVTGAMAAEAKCGGDKNSTKDMKKADAKCGTAKCGGDKKEIKKPSDAKCGAAKCGGEKK